MRYRPTKEDFINLLFDDDESTGFGSTNNETCHSKTKQQFIDCDSTNELFSVNSFVNWKETKNMKLTSLLFEVDEDLIPAEQVKVFLKSGMPFTTMTFSGNKSIHVIVRFTNIFESKQWSYQWWHAIAKVLKKYGMVADERARLATQISRVPESTRRDTQRKQTLIYTRERVSHLEMLEWIKQNGEMVYKPKEPKVYDSTIDWNSNKSDDTKFSTAVKWTERKYGQYVISATTGNWNWLFYYGQSCFNNGLSKAYAIQMAIIQWGTQSTGGTGPFEIAKPIEKGWIWQQNNKN